MEALKLRGRKTGIRQPSRLMPELKVLPKLLGLNIQTPVRSRYATATVLHESDAS